MGILQVLQYVLVVENTAAQTLALTAARPLEELASRHSELNLGLLEPAVIPAGPSHEEGLVRAVILQDRPGLPNAEDSAVWLAGRKSHDIAYDGAAAARSGGDRSSSDELVALKPARVAAGAADLQHIGGRVAHRALCGRSAGPLACPPHAPHTAGRCRRR